MEAIPNDNPNTRVVFADVGVINGRSINWGAPIFAKLGANHLPWFLVVDENGKITTSDDDTRKAYKLGN